MRVFVHVMLLACFLAAAWSAYHFDHKFEETGARLKELRAEIEKRRREATYLAVEWEVLNEPRRLQALLVNFHDRLLLEPIAPYQIRALPAASARNPSETTP